MLKTIAIMQPTYLPWLGYLAMIEKADVFVFLDDVQFDHRSWQQRNRIKTQNGEDWLTLSVKTKGASTQKINQVICIDIEKDTNKHLAKIFHNYSKSLFFKQFYPNLENFIKTARSQCHDSLAVFNIKIVQFLCDYIGIKKEFIMSSQLNICGEKDEYLAKICSALNGDIYLSASGSRIYLENSAAFGENNIIITYNDYSHPSYPQLYGNFIEGMSCIDAFFNVSKDDLKNLIISGCK